MNKRNTQHVVQAQPGYFVIDFTPHEITINDKGEVEGLDLPSVIYLTPIIAFAVEEIYPYPTDRNIGDEPKFMAQPISSDWNHDSPSTHLCPNGLVIDGSSVGALLRDWIADQLVHQWQLPSNDRRVKTTTEHLIQQASRYLPEKSR